MNEIQISNLKRIDEITSEIAKIDTQNVVGAIQLATKIDEMRMALQNPEIIKPLRSLLGSNMGIGVDTDYKTKQPANYPDHVVADCVLTALSQGYRLASPAGQEWMIFRGNFFAKKVGKFRKIIEFPGLTNFVHLVDPPAPKGDVVTVKCYAKWKLNGEQESIGYEGDECVFRLRQNSMSNDDNNIGKSESKLFSRILFRLTGSYIADIDDAESATDVTPKKEQNQEPEKKPQFMNEADLKKPEEKSANAQPENQEVDHFGIGDESQKQPEQEPETQPDPDEPLERRYKALAQSKKELREYVKTKIPPDLPEQYKDCGDSLELKLRWLDVADGAAQEFYDMNR